ncbi:unnamed protein product [Cutaneotrichosporon oleaginosum]
MGRCRERRGGGGGRRRQERERREEEKRRREEDKKEEEEEMEEEMMMRRRRRRLKRSGGEDNQVNHALRPSSPPGQSARPRAEAQRVRGSREAQENQRNAQWGCHLARCAGRRRAYFQGTRE